MENSAKRDIEVSINSPRTLSSLELAKVSGRPHHNILRSIERMNDDLITMGKTPAEFCEYKGANNKILIQYNLTKYQCELLAMALSGEARIRVLDKLYELDNEKPSKKFPTLERVTDIMNGIDVNNRDDLIEAAFGFTALVTRMSQEIIRNRERLEELESMKPEDHLKTAVRQLTGKDAFISLGAPIETLDDTHVTIKGWMSMHKKRLSDGDTKRLAHRARSLCEARGIKIEKIADARYGYLNLYPRDILDEVYI